MRTENWNGHGIRLEERDGEWWAVAKDVASALDYEDATHMLRMVDDDLQGLHKVKTVKRVVSHGKDTGKTINQENEMVIIQETGIYQTIFNSHKLEAKAFRRWIFEVIKTIRRDVLKLKEYETFRLMEKEHQKAAMHKLFDSLREPVKVDYIKVNMIADKAVSTMYGFPKLVKKPDMDESMLREREPILTDTVELMALNERVSSGAVYKRADIPEVHRRRGMSYLSGAFTGRDRAGGTGGVQG
jgi:prophage antirepressor-like protein